eukprot:UN09609
MLSRSWFVRLPNADHSNQYLFHALLSIAKEHSKDIIKEMDYIYNHLKLNKDFKHLPNIKNRTLISRPDHKNVGLFKQ